MNIFGFGFFLLAALATRLTAAPMEMTLYQYANYTGQSITLSKGQRDFNCTRDVIGGGHGILSMCYVGHWSVTTYASSLILFPYPTRRCSTTFEGYEHMTNVHQFGPEDTSIPAVSFDGSFGTQQLVYVAEPRLNITAGVISITFVRTSGRSDWTLFALNDFEGQSICLQATAELHRYSGRDLGLPSIGSAVRGCSAITSKHVVQVPVGEEDIETNN